MIEKKNDTSVGENTSKEKEDNGYQQYPAEEDIYNKLEEEENIDPEDRAKQKTPNQKYSTALGNEKNFSEDLSGADLDVPGSELDDEQEDIGNEDEENNYYSLGGDDHNNLDEDNS